MKVKWECILKNVVIPVAVGAIILVLGVLVMAAVMSNIAGTPDGINKIQYIVSTTPVNHYRGPEFIFPLPQVLLLMLGVVFVGTFIRQALKPCIIKEAGIMDNVVSGVSVIFDAVCFMISIFMGLIGVITIIAMLISLFEGNMSWIFGILSAAFIILSWLIYPSHQ